MSGLTYESTSRFVTTGDGLDLHYHEAGDGAVLVCLHGGGAGSMAWTQYCRNIDELSRHFRVLMFDLPQFGRSAKPDFTGDEVYPACARVVLAGLDALGVERAHFVGVSQGGGVTAFLAHDHPDRVARAVLVSPGGVWDSILTPTPMDVLRDTFAYYNPGPPDRATLTRILRGMLYDPSELTAEIEDRRWKASIDPDVIRVMSDFASQRLGDVRPLLPNIRHEILVLWGIEDRCLPLDTALVYLKGLPNAELLMLQRVGHWIPFERPDDFNRAVIEFFQRARPARPEA